MKEEITNEEFEKMSDDLVMGYAHKVTPRVWHQMAMRWNWDTSSVFLNWLVDNPDTDRATILMIYWKSAPRYYKQFADREDVLQKKSWAVKEFDFVERTEKNYVEGYYKTQQFAFDPSHDEGDDWTSEYANEPELRDIPAIMFEKLVGDQVEPPENFIEGMPPEVCEKLDDIYEQYDIIDDE